LQKYSATYAGKNNVIVPLYTVEDSQNLSGQNTKPLDGQLPKHKMLAQA